MTHAHFNSGVGTYPNRNHLAGLLEMALPFALGLLGLSVGRSAHRASGRTPGWRKRIAILSSSKGPIILGYGALVILLLIGLVFTRSRTGIALGMLGVLLSGLAFSSRLGGDKIHGALATSLAMAVSLAVIIGLAPVLERFAADTGSEGRWLIFPGSLDGIASFFPVGSGPGTYPEVFPPFQALEQGAFVINHAHNDYLEWLFETGAIGVVMIVGVLFLYVLRWREIWQPGKWAKFNFIQVGAGIGVLLLGLHGLLDYNLRIPANIAYFSFLVSIFWYSYSSQASPPGAVRRSNSANVRMKPSKEALPASKPQGPSGRFAPPPDQIRNPFDE
jgi:O-antigen ligase